MSAPLWGFPWHGLLMGFGSFDGQPKLRVGDAGGAVIPLNDAVFPENLQASLSGYLNGSDIQDVHIVRVPGIAPLELAPEEEAAQVALGRAWRNYGLLRGGSLHLHGKQLDGWICIDPAGARWLVRPVGATDMRHDIIDRGDPLTLSFDVVPFGYLGRPAATPVTLEVTLADIQQEGEALDGDPLVRPRIASIASHGRELLIELLPTGPSVSAADYPAGWLKLQLVGDGPNFGVSLGVLHSRTQALGVTEADDSGFTSVTWAVDVATSYNSETRLLTGTMTSITPSAPSSGRDMSNTRKGRILSVVFDDSDQVVTMSADITYTHAYSESNYTLTSNTGNLEAQISSITGRGRNTGAINYTMNHLMTDSVIYEVTLKRNGAQVENGRLQKLITSSIDTDGSLAGLYVATIDPQEFGIGAVGPGFEADVSSSMVTELQVNGASAYSHTDYSDRSGLPSFAPHVWGARVEFNVSTDGPYSNVSYRSARSSNQIIGNSYVLYNQNTQVSFIKQHSFIAAAAIWDNPSTTTDPGGAVSSYNPVTHEFAVSIGDDQAGIYMFI